MNYILSSGSHGKIVIAREIQSIDRGVLRSRRWLFLGVLFAVEHWRCRGKFNHFSCLILLIHSIVTILFTFSWSFYFIEMYRADGWTSIGCDRSSQWLFVHSSSVEQQRSPQQHEERVEERKKRRTIAIARLLLSVRQWPTGKFRYDGAGNPGKIRIVLIMLVSKKSTNMIVSE